MKSKTFDYRKIPNLTIPRKRWIKRPMLQVTLFVGPKHQQIICLVDSGADECLFHSSIGKSLGIDVEKGRRVTFAGISGTLDAYMHTIELQVQDFPDRIRVEAGFTDSDAVYAILGQAGFFENHEICFERYRWRIIVSPRESAPS